MELDEIEQEAIVVEQLEWLLNYERRQEWLDHELINALLRVLQEFKVVK